MIIETRCDGCGQVHGFDYQGLRSVSLKPGCDAVRFNGFEEIERLSREAETRENENPGSGFTMATDWR
jgi:hypothetical protein